MPSFRNSSGQGRSPFRQAAHRRSVVAVILRVDLAHRLLALAFLVGVRGDAGDARDDEQRSGDFGGDADVAADGGDRAVDVDRQRLAVGERRHDQLHRADHLDVPTFDLQLVDGLQVYDIPSALSGFNGPILVIGAGKDSVLPIERQRALSEKLKADGLAVTYLEIERSEHMNAALNTIFVSEATPFFAAVADSRH